VTFPNPTVTGGALQSIVPASGSSFGLGTTPVICTATNACTTNTCSFNVTVTQIPAVGIICPSAISTNICGNSVVVTFPNPTVTGGALQSIVPASGSSFGLGTTPVICTATNACTTNTCSFNVTVTHIPAVGIICPSAISSPTRRTSVLVTFPNPTVTGG